MRILVSTDGSEFSRAAIEKCCEIIAAPERTQIKIVSFFEIVEPLDISISPEFSKELEQSAREKAEESVRQSAAKIKEHFPDIEITTQISLGAPDQILIEAATEWKANLIIIGSHGRGFWSRMLLGSITDALVHNAPCSVLVVRRENYEDNEN